MFFALKILPDRSYPIPYHKINILHLNANAISSVCSCNIILKYFSSLLSFCFTLKVRLKYFHNKNLLCIICNVVNYFIVKVTNCYFNYSNIPCLLVGQFLQTSSIVVSIFTIQIDPLKIPLVPVYYIHIAHFM